MGECDKKSSFEILDCFYENGELPNISLVGARHIILNCTANGGMSGGNFIDTANNYQAEESETWIGEWMAACKNRDEIVLATKFTTAFPAGPKGIKANYQGNHSKSLKVSLEASLKKLQTDYIDLLYIHWWDFSTDSRTHAIPPPRRRCWKSSLPRHQRYPSLDRQQSESIRPRPWPHPIQRLPRPLERRHARL